MISYLPEIYPDELVYSWFCRYYVHSGCLTNTVALKEILYNRCNNPSKEFLGHLNLDMIEAIKKMYSLKDMIINHTMYPQYARFIPLEQKKKALYHMEHDFCDAHHLFSILPRNNSDRYLKYCPLCVQEDRMKYGEAYWHRIHQIRNMLICPHHNCKLENSTVTSKSEQTFVLCPAELYAVNTDAIDEINPLQIGFSKYMADIFNSYMDFKKDIPISAILHYGMVGTKYLSKTCTTKYTKRLSEDLQAYYARMDLSEIASMSQIQRLWFGKRFDFSVVCQIAHFIGISVQDMTQAELSAEQIEKERQTHYMINKQPIQWDKLDKEISPKLEKLAQAVYSGATSDIGRPERVSEKMIYREFQLEEHRLEQMPMCRSVFEKYSEPYEENWARRIIWAYNKLEREGKPFYWSDIRKISGVKKKNIDAIIPFIIKHSNEQIKDAILILTR